MIGAWMAYALGIGVGAGLAALAADRALGLLGRSRRWAWALALVVTALAPVALPVWRAGAVAPPEPVVWTMAERLRDAEIALALAEAPQPVRASIDWVALLDAALGWGWLAASVGGVVILLGSAASLHRLRAGWPRRKVAGVHVLLSGKTGPAVVGCFAASIVVPEWVLELPPEQQRLIVTHEREHAQARDPLLLAMARLAVALAPWNLALWWQLRRLQLAVEVDCDRRVLAGRANVERYGALLLEVGARSARPWLPAPAFSEPTSFLERRIRAMTAAAPRNRGVQAATLLLLLAAAPVALIAAPVVTHPALTRVALSLAAPRGRETAEEPHSSPAQEARPAPSAPAHEGPTFRVIALASDPTPRAARGDTVPDGIGGFAYEAKELDRKPELSNKGVVGSVMERLYPRLLQDAGVGGTVVAQFVIEVDGTINMRTLKVVEGSNAELINATRLAVERFRFRPGAVGERPVRTLIVMPVTWQPAERFDTTAVVAYRAGPGGLERMENTAIGYGAPADTASQRQRALVERAKLLIAQRYPSLLTETEPGSGTLLVITAPDGQVRDSWLVRRGEPFAWPAGTPTNFRQITSIRNPYWLSFAPALVGGGVVWFEL